MLKNLGRQISEIAHNVRHGGILVFFPCYAIMSKCKRLWESKKHNVYFTKPIQFEPKNPDLLDHVLNVHKRNCYRGGASILIGVCRGKLSEGYDYPDALARVVFVIGIPFPNVKDPKIIIKRQYYIKDEGKWLKDQTIRAVNQALGRVIRHKYDFGAIYLVDDRYCRDLRVERIQYESRHMEDDEEDQNMM